MRVVVLSDIPRTLPGWEEAFAILRQAGHEVIDLGIAAAGEPDPAQLAPADALLVGLNRITTTTIEAAPGVKVIARPGVGVDNIDLDAATARGIPVCNTPGSNADSVADHALAMMLALERDLIELDRRTRSGLGWSGPQVVPSQLTGKRLAIISTGHVGRAVAKRARAFEMSCVAYDPYPDPTFAAELDVEYLPFPDVLRGADVVSVHAPLVDSTRGLISHAELALLAPKAIVVVISRGGVVDEAALAAFLEDGRLGGAGVDVWANEPCTDSPLFDLANTILTPHVAGFSPEASRLARVMTAENLVAALAGRPTNVVNREVLSSHR